MPVSTDLVHNTYVPVYQDIRYICIIMTHIVTIDLVNMNIPVPIDLVHTYNYKCQYQ